MAKVKLTMIFDVPKVSDVDELKKLEHHVDYLLNLEGYPEIESVYGVEVEVISD